MRRLLFLAVLFLGGCRYSIDNTIESRQLQFIAEKSGATSVSVGYSNFYERSRITIDFYNMKNPDAVKNLYVAMGGK